ncbi:MAG TPA: type I restriction enzyme HsdR N-terminal domain-containing protein [Salinivirga sp.]|uniref:type I restriction enzyme HsdR N-terminal domain-containing protein n=1 Tax=Salinivirga sp. TaxID=1970192 RepID=UPI002B46B497|nr:type I restriction enzyme HsdR N-terminal domain-containing protein [Salinivirga sp.]HKK59002.1 type I restriction enzyme HsdR N-terminal domain-containing protein [Salinivirga sp.]
MYEKLNLPKADIQIRQNAKVSEIFDVVRKLWLPYTPEEWVRQNILHFLINYQDVPPSLIAVEMPIKVNRMERRCDIVVYSRSGKPAMIVECKAPGVKVTQKTVDQAGRYNLTLKAPYLMVSNGLKHYAFSIDFENESTTALKSIPDYSSLLRH